MAAQPASYPSYILQILCDGLTKHFSASRMYLEPRHPPDSLAKGRIHAPRVKEKHNSSTLSCRLGRLRFMLLLPVFKEVAMYLSTSR